MDHTSLLLCMPHDFFSWELVILDDLAAPDTDFSSHPLGLIVICLFICLMAGRIILVKPILPPPPPTVKPLVVFLREAEL